MARAQWGQDSVTKRVMRPMAAMSNTVSNVCVCGSF